MSHFFKFIPCTLLALGLYALIGFAKGEEFHPFSRERHIASTCQGAWYVAESANFQVCSLHSSDQAKLVARQCEQVRSAIVIAWQGKSAAWNPKCQVLLHRSMIDYVRAVGRDSEATHGSSLVSPRLGPVTARRIDLRTDVKDLLNAALPHELFHVIIADCFRHREAPLWFDEGTALLYDPLEKQRLHQRDYLLGVERHAAFPIADLMSLKNYPTADRWPIFYGQSAAVVRLLLNRETPQTLLRCVERSHDIGVTTAFRETYEARVWHDLERLSWPNGNSQVPAALLAQVSSPKSLTLFAVTGSAAN